MKSNIAELRKEKGLLQGYVAKKIGVSQQTLSDWEREEAYPKYVHAYKLAKILGVPMEKLYKEG
ncbi:helix-turn-helix transcriptional regulator [Virgibacillus sp. C22-A2]|uniref:Helix-turn-helix transcriptional regulator n=1 Tax=Virgibacillus tibetensis TaxID=3042313 RepID=A0ABU6KBE6_9BACI|nr:helix-turn-helix transcriptional regulator [Virgibacillus sp. C22-A2]